MTLCKDTRNNLWCIPKYKQEFGISIKIIDYKIFAIFK